MTNDSRKKYMKARYQKIIGQAKIHLGNKCNNCGIKDVPLDFDHIDPETKDFNITDVFTVSLVKFWQEVNKCQLLCEGCHVEKSLIESGKIAARKQHGTLSGYRWAKCRCEECRSAWNKYHRELKIKHKLNNIAN